MVLMIAHFYVIVKAMGLLVDMVLSLRYCLNMADSNERPIDKIRQAVGGMSSEAEAIISGISAPTGAVIAAELGASALGTTLAGGVPAVVLAADAARRAYNKGKKLEGEQYARVEQQGIAVGKNPDKLTRNAWQRISKRIKLGFGGHEQQKKIRETEDELTDVYDAAKAIEKIADMSLEDRIELLKEIADPESGDRSHASDIAVHEIVSGLEQYYRLQSEEEAMAAIQEDVRMADLEQEVIAKKRERAKQRRKYAQTMLFAQSPSFWRQEFEYLMREHGRDYAVQELGDRPPTPPEGEYMTEQEVRVEALSIQDSALGNIEVGLRALVEAGGVSAIRREVAKAVFDEEMERAISSTGATALVDKGKRRLRAWWNKARVERGSLDSTEVDARTVDSVERIISEQQDLLLGKEIDEQIRNRRSEAYDLSGALRYTVPEEGADGTVSDVVHIIDSYEAFRNAPAAEQDKVVKAAQQAAQRDLAEANKIIARYHEEYREFLERGKTTTETRTIEPGEKEVAKHIEEEDPVLAMKHKRYEDLHSMMVDVPKKKAARVKKYISARREEAERELGRLEPDTDEYKELKKRIAQYAELEAVSRTTLEGREKLLDFLAEEIKPYAKAEEEYLQKVEDTKVRLTITETVENEDVTAQLPQEYHDAVKLRGAALETLAVVREIRNGADVGRGEADRLLQAINARIDSLIDPVTIKQLELERDAMKKENMALVLDLDNELQALHQGPPPPVEQRVALILAKVLQSREEIGNNLSEILDAQESALAKLRRQKWEHLKSSDGYRAEAEAMGIHRAFIEEEIANIYGDDFLDRALRMTNTLHKAQEVEAAVSHVHKKLTETGSVDAPSKRNLRNKMIEAAEEVSGLSDMTDAEAMTFLSRFTELSGGRSITEDDLRQIKEKAGGGLFSMIMFLMMLLSGQKREKR